MATGFVCQPSSIFIGDNISAMVDAVIIISSLIVIRRLHEDFVRVGLLATLFMLYFFDIPHLLAILMIEKIWVTKALAYFSASRWPARCAQQFRRRNLIIHTGLYRRLITFQLLLRTPGWFIDYAAHCTRTKMAYAYISCRYWRRLLLYPLNDFNKAR